MLKSRVLLVPMLLIGSVQADEPPVVPIGPLIAAPVSELAPVVVRWGADGRGLDGARRVDSWPSARRDRLEFAQGWRERLREVDFDALGIEGKVDYLLLDNQLRDALEDRRFQEKRDREIAPYTPFAGAIEALEAVRFRLGSVDPEAAAASLATIRTQADDLRKALAARKPEEKPAPWLADRAQREVDENRQALGRWFRHYEGFDPMVSWWCREPLRLADEALGEWAKALREAAGLGKEPSPDRKPPLQPPLGAEELAAALRTEMIVYNADELVAVAEREFAWCDAERKKAAAELGFGDDWKAALERIKKDVLKPGEQDRAIRALAAETLAFLDANDLVTVPRLARENWTLDPTPAESQKTNPYFFYTPPSSTVGLAYPSEKMGHADKLGSMRSNNAHFTRNAALHELIPGHHLQSFMNARSQTHRRSFGTPFWMEGWSLYWEMLAWDLGFAKTPEDRLGFLFWRSHRCARVVFSLRYHQGRMTSEEAVDYLVDRVGHERAAAEGEVRRSLAGGYGPLYQASYMIGGLQFRALAKELVKSGKTTYRQFHDRILAGGPMPVEMVRVRLTAPRLSRDFRPSWRFAGEIVPGVRTSP